MSQANKIRATHLERTAIVYVRQSSPAQVRDNRESQARQYGLVEEAARLGWPASKIDVIDADLGLSGRSAERRSGFREVVSRVCLGEVGAIFGLEVSRLARSSADLARLLELARLTDTLVIDTDGMYDLREFNDRLLLGLKGAMSEAELHILAGRLQGAKRAAAERWRPALSVASRLCSRYRRRHRHRPRSGGGRSSCRRLRRVPGDRFRVWRGRHLHQPTLSASSLWWSVGG